jgi:CheY-like chemotaxis protein
VELLPYDVVFMDCEMPVLDGFAATAEIRCRYGAVRHVPIVAMTAGALRGDRERCLQAGMDDYISKPIGAKLLKAVLDRWATCAARLDNHAIKGASRNLSTAQIGELAAQAEQGAREGRGPDAEPLADPPEREFQGRRAGVARQSASLTGVDQPPAVDRAVLASLRSLADATDPTLLEQIVQSFLNDSRTGLATLRQVNVGDAEGLRKTAHGLKGMCASVGAENMRVICQELEALGASDSVAGALELIDRLDNELQRAESELGAALHEDAFPGQTGACVPNWIKSDAVSEEPREAQVHQH